jgi:hypothetical protein
VKRSNIWVSAFVGSFLSLISLAYGQRSTLRFPESRSYSPGKIWLAWTPAERDGFVKGFILGHDDGYQSGCRAAAEAGSATEKHPDSDFDPCLQKRHLFRKDAAFYREFITDFYTRYPMDRDVPIRILLLQADEKNADELHQWLAKKSD